VSARHDPTFNRVVPRPVYFGPAHDGFGPCWPGTAHWPHIDPGGPGGAPRLLSSREFIHPLSVYGELSLEHRLRFVLNGKMEHLTTHLHRPRTTRSPLSFWVTEGSYHSSLFSCFSQRSGESSNQYDFPNPPFLKGRM
jgi:hypothetical protein